MPKVTNMYNITYIISFWTKRSFKTACRFSKTEKRLWQAWHTEERASEPPTHIEMQQQAYDINGYTLLVQNNILYIYIYISIMLPLLSSLLGPRVSTGPTQGKMSRRLWGHLCRPRPGRTFSPKNNITDMTSYINPYFQYKSAFYVLPICIQLVHLRWIQNGDAILTALTKSRFHRFLNVFIFSWKYAINNDM